MIHRRGSSQLGYVRLFKLVLVVWLAAAVLVPRSSAQSPQAAASLKFSLFDRYLESLRQQAGIPGLSAVIVQERRIVWERVAGSANVEESIPVLPITTFVVGDLTQTFAAVLLMQCVERGTLGLNESMRRWTPLIPDASATVRQVLLHISEPPNLFKYNPSRYATLAQVIEGCGQQPYRKLLAEEILDPLGMIDSVPGQDLGNPLSPARTLFEEEKLQQYSSALRRVAVPYKLDKRGRPTRTEYTPTGINAAIGLVTTARDLSRFDAALDDFQLLLPETVAFTRTNAVAGTVTLPVGYGWFVQQFEGRQVVWRFAAVPDAYSSLIVKIPEREVTLILLANSEGLSAPFALEQGDVTTSLFARLFLRLFI